MKGKFLISLVAMLAVFASSHESGQCMEDGVRPNQPVSGNNNDENDELNAYEDVFRNIPRNLWLLAANTAHDIQRTLGSEYGSSLAYITVNNLYRLLTNRNSDDENVFGEVKSLMLEYWPALLQEENIEGTLNLQDGYKIVSLVVFRYSEYGTVDELKQRMRTVSQHEILMSRASHSLEDTLKRFVKNYEGMYSSNHIHASLYRQFESKFAGSKYENNDYETRCKKINEFITWVKEKLGITRKKKIK